MITENVSTLKIHKLTQAQYDRELAAGNLDQNALYLTPDEEIDLTPYAVKEEVNATYETKSDASAKLEEAKLYADTTATAIKNDLLNGAGEAYDTLKELGELIDDNKDALDALIEVATNKADKEHTHSYNDLEDRTHYMESYEGTESRRIEVVDRYGGSIIDLDFAKLLVEHPENATCIGDGYSGTFKFVSITDKNEGVKRIAFTQSGTFYADVTLETGHIQLGDGGYGRFNGGSIVISGVRKERAVKLDEKYIPDSIARVSDIPEQVQQVQPDWNEEDETSPAFIHNKPENLGGETIYIYKDLGLSESFSSPTSISSLKIVANPKADGSVYSSINSIETIVNAYLNGKVRITNTNVCNDMIGYYKYTDKIIGLTFTYIGSSSTTCVTYYVREDNSTSPTSTSTSTSTTTTTTTSSTTTSTSTY